jgi:S1-C subfamily serine protease
MVQTPIDKTPFPKLTRGRTAAVALGLGATLALSPMVWAENPAPGATAVPQTMTSPVALIQQQSFAPLVKKVLPAVVNISVTQKSGADQMSEEQEQSPGSPFQGFPNSPFDEMLRRFFEQQNPDGGGGHAFPQMPGGQPQRIALGSGFIVDPSGYVVTNNHVVGDAGKVEVILQDKSKYTAKIVGRDPKTDLAVLKIKADKPLPYVSFGDSSAAQVGDWVMAVGNPFGLGGTVTTGIILKARSSASTPRSTRPTAAASASALRYPRTSPRTSSPNSRSTAKLPVAGLGSRSRKLRRRSRRASGCTTTRAPWWLSSIPTVLPPKQV